MTWKPKLYLERMQQCGHLSVFPSYFPFKGGGTLWSPSFLKGGPSRMGSLFDLVKFALQTPDKSSQSGRS